MRQKHPRKSIWEYDWKQLHNFIFLSLQIETVLHGTYNVIECPIALNSTVSQCRQTALWLIGPSSKELKACALRVIGSSVTVEAACHARKHMSSLCYLDVLTDKTTNSKCPCHSEDSERMAWFNCESCRAMAVRRWPFAVRADVLLKRTCSRCDISIAHW